MRIPVHLAVLATEDKGVSWSVPPSFRDSKGRNRGAKVMREEL